jgi:tripartite-type tricarboxylate transporter receptor subunit TctC
MLLSPVWLRAAPAYPQRPITLISPFAANSDASRFGQQLAQQIGPYLAAPAGSAPIKVDSLPGESGLSAARTVLRSPADGYTLLLARVSTQIIVPLQADKLPYNNDDFSFISLLEVTPVICAVRSAAPWHSARDLLAAMRKNPGSLKYSTSGPNTILNMVPQYLFKLSGLKPNAAKAVHFDSGVVATEALQDGRVDFICNNISSMIDGLRHGSLRPLFSTAPGRIAILPQVPNATEAGLRDLAKMGSWIALMGPKGLPPEVITRWRQALAQMAQQEAWAGAVQERGALLAIGSPIDNEQFLRDQLNFYQQLLLGLKAQP